jgi:hypothetical protein
MHVLELQQHLIEKLTNIGDIDFVLKRSKMLPKRPLIIGYDIKVTADRTHSFHIVPLADAAIHVATRELEMHEGQWRPKSKWRGLCTYTDIKQIIDYLNNYHDNLRY